MAEQAPPRRPDIAASKLRAPTRTCYFNSFFLFKTEVALDGRPAEIGCSQDGELSLSCRLEQDGESKKTSVSFPSISAKVEGILKKYGVFEVVTFFCEDSPLFQVTFSSEDELKRFLRRRERVEKELADLFSHMLQPMKGQAQVQATPIPAQVSSTLFLMTPDWYGSRCGSVEVSLENYSDCVSVWRDSKMFKYGAVLNQEKNPKISIVKQSLTTSTSDLRQGQDTATSTSDLRQGQDTTTNTSDLRQGQDTATSTTELREIMAESSSTIDPNSASFADRKGQSDGSDELSVGSVVKCLEEVFEWFILGTCLSIPHHKLKVIEQDHPQNCERCKTEMVDTWICLGGASWSGLAKALWEIGRRGLAKKMAAKFGLPLPADTSDQKEPSVLCDLLTDISLKDQSLEDTTAALVLAEEKRNEALEEIAEPTRLRNQHVTRLPQLELEKEQLSTQLRETREGHQKLEELLGKHTHALHTLKQETTRLHSQFELKDREIAVMTAEAEELKAKLQETTDQLTAASNELNKLKAEQVLLKFELESKRRELEKEQSKSEATVKEVKGKQQKTLPTSFEWWRCRDAPVIMWAATSVVMNGRVYIGYTPWRTPQVLEYTPENDEWAELPKPPVKECGFAVEWFVFAVLNNQLVLVGGREISTKRPTNNIAVFEPSTRQWVQHCPPMPTARSRPSAIVYKHYLIVAGGEYDKSKSLSTVEVLDSVNKKWYSAEEVPVKCDLMTPVVISDTAYLLEGRSNGKRTKTVLALSLPALINNTISQPQDVNTPTSWKMLPDSPLYRSAPFTSHGMLLTAGGEDESREECSPIYCYDPVTNQWEKVGDLPEPCYGCGCAVLPSTELLVMGGWPYTNLTSVYKATIQWK